MAHRVSIQALDANVKEVIHQIVNAGILLKDEREENDGGGFKQCNADHWTEFELNLRHLADRATRLACGIAEARAAAQIDDLMEQLAY